LIKIGGRLRVIPKETWLGKHDEVNKKIFVWKKKFPEIIRVEVTFKKGKI